MKYLILAFGLLLANPVLAADASGAPLKDADRDFSALLMPRSPFLGFIGGDYQRLYIKFLTVAREPQAPNTYDISGYAVTRGRQTPFAGKLTIQKVGRVTQMHYGVDDEMKGKVKAEGTAFGDYELTETTGGRFTGAMTLNWYLDRNGKLAYDNIDIASDGYCNNQYTGTWQADATSSPQVANWGEYRIPNSGDLDIGAAEFAPNDKYLSQGWSAPVPHR